MAPDGRCSYWAVRSLPLPHTNDKPHGVGGVSGLLVKYPRITNVMETMIPVITSEFGMGLQNKERSVNNPPMIPVSVVFKSLPILNHLAFFSLDLNHLIKMSMRVEQYRHSP